MMRRYNRLLVLFFRRHRRPDQRLVVRACLHAAVPLAHGHHSRHQGISASSSTTASCCPFVMAILPLAFHVQGVYHLRRGRSRVDDFFAVFVGSILAVVFGVGGTLYYNTYYVPDPLKDLGVYEVSQLVWAFYLVINIVLAYASREFVRETLRTPMEGRHRAEACPDCRRRRSWKAGRGQGPRASGTRIQGGRLPGRPRRRRSHRVSRPAAARHVERGGRDHPPGERSITSTWRFHSRST